ncbi:unnamed protein product, partial [Ectocarpus sp. 4 AP-2014]
SPPFCPPAPAEPAAARKAAFATSSTPPAAAVVEASSGHTDGTEGQHRVRWKKRGAFRPRPQNTSADVQLPRREEQTRALEGRG